MRVFVTGAGGHIASAVIPELLQAGHEVVGLVRSDVSEAAVKALGAEVRRGDLADLAGLREAAADADGVIHLAFDNAAAIAAGDLAGAAAADRTVVRAFGDVLAGTGKTLMGIGTTGTGSDDGDRAINANPRSAVAREVAALADRGVRSLLVAIPPVVHSERDTSGFVPTLIRIARSTGVSGYVDDGTNRWPAVHTRDLARLYRLALEKAPAGAQLTAAADEGIAVREIAENIARHLGIPAKSIPADRAADHFGPFGPIMTLGLPPMSSAETQEMLGWTPAHPGLIADLDQGHYFTRE